MKTILKVVLLTLFVSMGFANLSFANDDSHPRLISVTGDADVKVVPDEIIFTLGVETINKNLNTAKSENDKRIQKIIELAKQFEIEKKHIQIDHISIRPRYEYEDHYKKNPRKLIGYFVRKTMVLTLRDTAKFEDVLSAVLGSANYVHGVQFRTTELRKHKDQARSLAIHAAREKATDLARELGQKIGEPYSIREVRSGWWSPYGWWGSHGYSSMAQNVVQTASSESSESDSGIALGLITVNAKIDVQFELE